MSDRPYCDEYPKKQSLQQRPNPYIAESFHEEPSSNLIVSAGLFDDLRRMLRYMIAASFEIDD